MNHGNTGTVRVIGGILVQEGRGHAGIGMMVHIIEMDAYLERVMRVLF